MLRGSEPNSMRASKYRIDAIELEQRARVRIGPEAGQQRPECEEGERPGGHCHPLTEAGKGRLGKRDPQREDGREHERRERLRIREEPTCAEAQKNGQSPGKSKERPVREAAGRDHRLVSMDDIRRDGARRMTFRVPARVRIAASLCGR